MGFQPSGSNWSSTAASNAPGAKPLNQPQDRGQAQQRYAVAVCQAQQPRVQRFAVSERDAQRQRANGLHRSGDQPARAAGQLARGEPGQQLMAGGLGRLVNADSVQQRLGQLLDTGADGLVTAADDQRDERADMAAAAGEQVVAEVGEHARLGFGQHELAFGGLEQALPMASPCLVSNVEWW